MLQSSGSSPKGREPDADVTKGPRWAWDKTPTGYSPMIPVSMLHLAAQQYAIGGLAVFPLRPGTKGLYAGSHAYLDATTNLQQIDAWWSASKLGDQWTGRLNKEDVEWTAEANSNIGAVPVSIDCTVFDVDEKTGRDGKRKLDQLSIQYTGEEFPYTVNATTASEPPGAHLWTKGAVAWDGPAGFLLAEGDDGVDIKCRGGFVVMAPSVIGDLAEMAVPRTYGWNLTVDRTKLARLVTVPTPQWILDVMAEAHAQRTRPRDKATLGLKGVPMGVDSFRRMLGYHDPGVPRGEWFPKLAAIKSSPVAKRLPQGGWELLSGEEMYEIALAWCRGKLDRFHQYDKEPPTTYLTSSNEKSKVGDAGVSTNWESAKADYETGTHIGSLILGAKEQGYAGPTTIVQEGWRTHEQWLAELAAILGLDVDQNPNLADQQSANSASAVEPEPDHVEPDHGEPDGSKAGAEAHERAEEESVSGADDVPDDESDNSGDCFLSRQDHMRSAIVFASSAPYTRREGSALVYWRGDFWLWNGACYRIVEPDAMRASMWKFLSAAKIRRKVVDKETAAETLAQAPFLPEMKHISNVMDALKSRVGIASDIPAPSWLDDTSDAGIGACQIVPCRNGLLHLPTRTLLPHTPKFFGLNALDFDFDPQAPQPVRWLEFLNQIFPGDPDAIACLQEIFGYLLSGETGLQKVFTLIGAPRGGKGTVSRVITKLLGAANVSSPSLGALATQFGLESLIGKTLAVVPDARLGARTDQSAIIERLLSVSGEDSVNIPRKWKGDWTGKLGARFLLLSNEIPKFSDPSGATASRFIMLEFAESFLGREDPDLLDKLLPELPSVMNWSLVGWRRLKDQGKLTMPESSREMVEDTQELTSIVTGFVHECCALSPEASVSVQALYDGYRRWCQRRGHIVASAAIFGRDLKSAFRGRVKRVRARVCEQEDENRFYRYDGITLKPFVSA